MNKKIFLGSLSSLVAVATPVATAVSCAQKNDSIILNIDIEKIIANVVERMKNVQKTSDGYDAADPKFVNPTYFLISEVLRSSFKSMGEISYPIQKIFEKLKNPAKTAKNKEYDYFYQITKEIVDERILGDLLGIKTGNETTGEVIATLKSKITNKKTITDTIDKLISNTILLTLTNVLRDSQIDNSDLLRIVQGLNGKRFSINLKGLGNSFKTITLPKEDGAKINLGEDMTNKITKIFGNNDNVDFKAIISLIIEPIISLIIEPIINWIKPEQFKNTGNKKAIDAMTEKIQTFLPIIEKVKKAYFLDDSNIIIIEVAVKNFIKSQTLIDQFIKIYKK